MSQKVKMSWRKRGGQPEEYATRFRSHYRLPWDEETALFYTDFTADIVVPLF